jgi:hypothetical protein
VSVFPGYQPLSRGWQTAMAVIQAVVSAVSTAADLVALCWFGMWMGLTSRSANLATLKTIVFVEIIPWFVMAFVLNMGMGVVFAAFAYRGGGFQSMSWFGWWPLLSAVLSGVFAVGKDAGFIVWSRRKLHGSFREEAARSLGQPRFVVPRPVPVVADAPPVITGSN